MSQLQKPLWLIAAEQKMDAAPVGSVLFAGKDVFRKVAVDDWWRDDEQDHTTTAELADFHGNSGYTIVRLGVKQ